MEVLVNQTVVLECDVIGFPEPDITWYQVRYYFDVQIRKRLPCISFCIKTISSADHCNDFMCFSQSNREHCIMQGSRSSLDLFFKLSKGLCAWL